MPPIFMAFGISKDFATAESTRIYVIITICVGLFPLFIKRNLDALANFSFTGILAILYIIIIITVETPQQMEENFDKDELCWLHISINGF